MTKFGRPHRHFAECGSTNDIAREWALESEEPAPSGALVTADFQTRGRGQRGHEWQAEAGQSALMSYVYHVQAELNASQLGFVTALAVAEVCRTPDVFAQIKWPNDILLNNKKVAGILVEVAAGVAILGVGINVSQTEFANAAGFAYAPTSLHLENGEQQTIRRVIKTFNRHLAWWEERWRREGFAQILERCKGSLAVGATVRQGEVSGTLTGLSEQGAAIVRLPDGTFAEWTTVD
ncbi:MAG: biotin--[acetyl-CoA-carboxylase] ligase [Janthinobacterium lividum]